MAQVTLWGATYSDVPAVNLPKTGGGLAQFDDTTDANATAPDILAGKTAYVNGVKVTGTGTGGGSGDGYVWQDQNGYVHLSDEPGTQVQVDALSVNQNGTYTAASGHAYSPVTVNVPSGGGAVQKQVNLIDYDGTILHSYTAAEANALTALPSNPSHTGLVAQGWNWTLQEIKAQLTAMPDGYVWVGQMYVTSSGDTEIDVSFIDSARLSPYLGYAIYGTATVDWGDNSTDTITGNSIATRQSIQHIYATTGNYTITIHVESGTFVFYGTSTYLVLHKNVSTANANKVYANCVQAIRLGNNVSIGSYAFNYCYSLVSVTIPSSVTSIGLNAFYYCYSLTSITIPSDVTSTGTSTFSNCYSLTSIAIPSSVTSIGTSTFEYCYSLTSITIPSGVTSIGSNVFTNCLSLANITIPSGITSIGSSVFNGCNSLANITIPSNVTSIGNSAFSYCYSLASITIPSNVTSIGNSAFNNCLSLASITIPSNVTSIGNSAFSNCYGVSEYHIKPTAVPTLGTTAFNNIQSDCIIYVPSASLSDYQSTTNWSTYASYMAGE